LGRVVVVKTRGRAGNVDDVDAGEHTESLHEVDRRRHATGHAVRLVEARQRRLHALSPQPDLRRGRADVGRRVAHDGARRIHQREELRRGGTGREHRRRAGEIVRRNALGVGPVAGYDTEVAVLDAGMEAHAVATVSQRGVEGGDDRWLCALDTCPAAKSTITGGSSSETVTRLQRYATSSGPSSTPIAAASIGARAGVVLRGS
jgi:hypothetical protein